jgi:hypothetical protein
MNYERLLPYSREIAKEVLYVIFRFVGANRVYNINLLIVFLLPKNTYIAWLKQVSLVGGELNYSYPIIGSFKDKIVHLVAGYSVD